MGKLTVLVIDDDPRLMRSMTELLKFRGYDVIQAFSVVEGLNAALQSTVSAIVLDLSFGQRTEEEGLRLLRQFKENSRLRDIPVLVYSISAKEGSEPWIRSIRLTAEMVCSKGVSIEQAVDMIGMMIAKREQLRSPSRPLLLPLDYDYLSNQVFIEGLQVKISLTAQDARLLRLLVEHTDRICTYEMIVDNVFEDPPNSNEAIHQAVRRLRKALNDITYPHRYIATVRERGYRLVVRERQVRHSAD